MDFIDRTTQMFRQTNDDIEKLLTLTGSMSKSLKNNRELQKEALAQIDKILVDAKAIGGQLIQEVKTIQSELDAYLEKPSEQMRVKMMQNAMHLKNQTREL
jgi:hypothetical protein